MLFFVIFYLAITVVGVVLFRGIPILNVALGFIVGAFVAHRQLTHRADRVPDSHNGPAAAAPAHSPLRTVFAWALGTAGLTMVVCWFELGASLLTIKVFGTESPLAYRLPLLPSDGLPNLFRAQLFAVIISPGLQILTTVFGGVLTVLLTPRR